MKFLSIILITGLLLLTGCDNDSSGIKAETDKKTVFDGHLNALDKAKNIENVLQQSAKQRQQQIDSQ